ncbi:HAMP domain-containing histidine kinase [Undibacterium sp. LX40W]|uniref:histidine kinase n=1 Tax=Undibacterium nitidum TaxID=2762298 RepID=A0A923HNS4_9BURK|nr:MULTISPECIES: HAMP domain-containing sensor histidine kinase [Undibacterium]MBC3881196.1 HAMP domain-containing histidine kinase [Undibacterium nitidum]MBC3890071.1 HAMP domain-containing histidine kinase [Undibacterium sp. LX40W]
MHSRKYSIYTWGFLAIASVAALILLLNSYVASRSLAEAKLALASGEGHALISRILQETRATEQPITATPLSKVLRSFESKGLRYIAVSINGKIVEQAGAPLMKDPDWPVGDVRFVDQRARLVGVLPPVLPTLEQLLQSPIASDDKAISLPHLPAAPSGDQNVNFVGRVIVEFETPLIAQLTSTAFRSNLIVWLASSVLLVLALVFTRNAIMLREIEHRAERDRQLTLLGEMSAVVAHELRNPLAALKGHSQLLADLLTSSNTLNSSALKKAERIVVEAERLEKLTHVLLDFVRNSPLDLKLISPQQLVAELFLVVAEAEISTDFSNAPEIIYTDTTRLVMALSNLVRNAQQAAPRTVIELVFKTDDEFTVIEVCDRGPGLETGSEEEIFERLVSTRSVGTGLGLAAVRRAVNQLGGTVSGENRPGGGAIFRIKLPQKMK